MGYMLRVLFTAALLMEVPAVSIKYANPESKRTDEQNCFIFTVRPGAVSRATARALHASVTGTDGGVFTNLNGFWRCNMDPAQVQRLADNPNVVAVQEDQVFRALATQNNPPWGLDRVDQRDLPLSSSYTYDSDAQGAGAFIFVLDTGILNTHNEFSGRMKPGRDTVGGDTVDCHGHGTHCAGTAAGTTYGIAKEAWLVPVRVLNCGGSGSTSGIVTGIDWVISQTAMRPAVISMSLGGFADSVLDAAVQRAIDARITVVVAAGNENTLACSRSPARAPNAITVGATTNTDTRAGFSNYGTCVDIFAPGQDVLSSWIGGNTATRTISGTSMATPHVAGAAAVILGQNPGWSPAQVASALVGGASRDKVRDAKPGSPNRLLFVLSGTIGPFSPDASPVSASPVPTVANDLCANAIRTTCGATVTGSTELATPDTGIGSCMTSGPGAGVWYVVDMPVGTTSFTVSTAGSSYDTQLSVLQGSVCNTWSCAGYNDDNPSTGGVDSFVAVPSSSFPGSPSGRKYFILVHGWGSATGNFRMVVNCVPQPLTPSPQPLLPASPSPVPSSSPRAPLPPSASPVLSSSSPRAPLPSPGNNDQCAGAIELQCGSVLTGTTQGATADPILQRCTTSPTAGLGVWYFIDVPVGSPSFLVSTAGSSYDTQLSVFRGGVCGGMTCAGSNDDAGGITSRVNVTQAAGNRFHIIVHGYRAIVGAFRVAVTCTGAPNASPSPSRAPSQSALVSSSPSPVPSPSPSPAVPNDVCTAAIALRCGETEIGSTLNATVDDLSSCTAAESSGLAAWWYIDMPAGMVALTLSTLGSDYDTQLSVFSSQCDNLSCLAKNDDGFKTLSSYILASVTPGTRYYVAVHGYQESVGNVKLTAICDTTPVGRRRSLTDPAAFASPSVTSSDHSVLLAVCAMVMAFSAMIHLYIYPSLLVVHQQEAKSVSDDVDMEATDVA